MDPAVFFGRSRSTRQTLKTKQISDAGNVNREVTTRAKRSCVEDSEKVTKALASVQLGASGKKNAIKAIGGTVMKSTMETCKENAHAETKLRVPRTLKKRVQFGANEKMEPDELTQSGPVYKNVRRSDVVGDTSDVYDFPVDENDEPFKKKKPRKVNKTQKQKKNLCGIVVWDPSKRPILKKTIAPKSVKSKAQKIVKTTGPLEVTSLDIPDAGLEPSKKLRPQPLNPTNGTLDTLKASCNSTHRKKIPEIAFIGRPSTSGLHPSTHSEASGSSSSLKLSVCTVLCEELQEESATPSMQPQTPITPKLGPNNKRVASALQPASNGSKTPDGVSSLSFQAGNHFASTPVPSSGQLQRLNPACAVSSTSSLSPHDSEFISESQQPRKSMRTCASSFSPVPKVCVRESPSFKEPETPVKSSNVLDAPCSKSIEDIASTPLTRSKSAQSYKSVNTNHSALSAATPSHCEGTAPTSNSFVKSSWAQENVSSHNDTIEMFEDFACTNAIPTRMFSTHRGTIFAPSAEKTITKRKLPAISPSREPKIPRPNTVRFSPSQPLLNVEDCFGFDEDDSYLCSSLAFPPQKKAPQDLKTKKQEIKKPNLTIQEVQAVLKGHLKASSPARSTPRTLQTKLTDFVSSVPSSTPSRPSQHPCILTPTPVPLFGEEEIDCDLPSPYIQPSRRSYDRFRRGKLIACGDEVHSDEEEGNLHIPVSTSSIVPEVKKKSRSYRKKKKPTDTQLDTWADQLASHFDEVEEVELQVE